MVKYRGSAHGTNEYPFFISARGFVVLPITSITLDYGAPEERISTANPIEELKLASVDQSSRLYHRPLHP